MIGLSNCEKTIQTGPKICVQDTPKHIWDFDIPEPLHTQKPEKLMIEMIMHDLQVSQSSSESIISNSNSGKFPRIVYDCFEPEKVDRRGSDLKFESRFESGNCRQVMIVSENEYDIVTCCDVNTNRHTQWFYFAVSNINPKNYYKFNFLNMEKPSSEFNTGMRPLFYSEM